MTAEFLTPYALHKRWGGAISPKTLANWRAKNIGPQWKKVGGRVVYPVQDVLFYEASSGAGNQPELDRFSGLVDRRAAGVLHQK